MAMSFKEQILSPNWQRRRLEIMQRDEFMCQRCYDSESTLNVHHKQYIKGRMYWEYPDEDLVTLCESCHEYVTEVTAQLRSVIARLPMDGPANIDTAAPLIGGWAHGRQTPLDFTELFKDDPRSFVIGLVAGQLDFHTAPINTMLSLSDAIRDAPPWVLESEFRKLLAALIDRREEPMPDGWKHERGFE